MSDPYAIVVLVAAKVGSPLTVCEVHVVPLVVEKALKAVDDEKQ
jgi:hypothetical protein